MTPTEIRRLAQSTSDAYSADAYASWISVIRMLDKRGYNEREIEAIVRSKFTRWCRDAEERRYAYGNYPASSLAKFLDDPRNSKNLAKDVADLVVGTFGVTA